MSKGREVPAQRGGSSFATAATQAGHVHGHLAEGPEGDSPLARRPFVEVHGLKGLALQLDQVVPLRARDLLMRPEVHDLWRSIELLANDSPAVASCMEEQVLLFLFVVPGHLLRVSDGASEVVDGRGGRSRAVGVDMDEANSFDVPQGAVRACQPALCVRGLDCARHCIVEVTGSWWRWAHYTAVALVDEVRGKITMRCLVVKIWSLLVDQLNRWAKSPGILLREFFNRSSEA